MRHSLIGLIGAAAVLCASTALAQTGRDIRGPAAVVPLASEPAPRIVIDPPLADWLAHGRVVVQYRAENLRIVPVFGPNALDARTLGVLSDKSYPFSSGRNPGRPDDNEFILVRLDAPLPIDSRVGPEENDEVEQDGNGDGNH